ncbi:hypothetical protein KP509_22G018700 [Ceratopteris richardii]|uniref:Uncharacterized protein n=1 Tax=Ceratopteris richardii TaxID=49495 RepID=A0A8T2S320_CERRI|nr:hypothetical protein KP509_22G018700 [Ceratopteris richardii]
MSSTTKMTLWYDYPDKDREVAAPNGQAIAPGSILYVAACGRENSPSGNKPLDFNTAPSSGPIGMIPFAIYQK